MSSLLDPTAHSAIRDQIIRGGAGKPSLPAGCGVAAEAAGGEIRGPRVAALHGESVRANLECEMLSVGGIDVRSVVVASPDETVRAAAERVVNACVLDFLTAEHGVARWLREESRT
jgi:hypothetical protein